MYLATWKEYTTLQTLQIQVLGEIRTQEVVSTENYSRYGGQNSLVSSDMKRVQDFSRTKVFDDIVGDLKIDALYIFDKALLTTHHFVVLKDDKL
jgi:hypothetical protein